MYAIISCTLCLNGHINNKNYICSWSKQNIFTENHLKSQSEVSRDLKNTNRKHFLKSLKQFKIVYILVQLVNNALVTNMVTICMAGRIIFEMSTVFMVIKMPRLLCLVPPKYLCTVVCVIVFPILMHLENPQAAAVHENTKQALRIWKLQTSILTAKRKTHFRKFSNAWDHVLSIQDLVIHMYNNLFDEEIGYYALLWYNYIVICKLFDIRSTWSYSF